MVCLQLCTRLRSTENGQQVILSLMGVTEVHHLQDPQRAQNRLWGHKVKAGTLQEEKAKPTFTEARGRMETQNSSVAHAKSAIQT